MAFGALLRQYRLAAGLSQETLAERAGLSVRAVSDLERGVHRAPQAATVRLLADALELSPVDRARLDDAISRRRQPRRVGDAATPAADAAHGSNLPAAFTSFVGRAAELMAVRRLLDTARLVTLTGPGGIGKTRLALEAAGGLIDRFPHGIWLVELAALADDRLVARTVAGVLDVREEPNLSALESVLHFLRDKRLLLLLDNCEHLLDASAALVNALLGGCPGLRVLTTSRQALGLIGETVYRVPPLRLPEHLDTSVDADSMDLGGLADAEAVQLFVDRARATAHTFTLSTANVAAVARVCGRLDGIPLALELAAAWVPVLPIEEIAARLDDCFRLLIGGSRRALPRQQTLQATLDWSYDLLSPGARVLFQRLSLFTGGFTLPAAATVCAGDGIASHDLVGLLRQLVDASMVTLEPPSGAGESRYQLLEPLRQYGWEQLQRGASLAAWQGRHAAYYRALAEAAEPGLTSADSRIWMRRLAAERYNLQAALGWAVEQGDAEAAMRFVGALGWWFRYGSVREGRRWAETALAMPQGFGSTVWRAKVLGVAGLLSWRLGDAAAARAYLGDAVALSRQVDDRRSLALALMLLATLSADEPAAARVMLSESIAIFEDRGDHWYLALAYFNQGYVQATWGDAVAARRSYETSRELYRQLGDAWSAAMPSVWLGHLALRQGDYASARSLFDECLGTFRAVGDASFIGQTVYGLGRVAVEEGEAAQAGAYFAECLATSRRTGEQHGIATALYGCAQVASLVGSAERAARLLSRADALIEPTGYRTQVFEPEAYDRVVQGARRMLGEERFAAAWAAGRDLPLESAVAEALAVAAELGPAAGDGNERVESDVPRDAGVVHAHGGAGRRDAVELSHRGTVTRASHSLPG